MSRSYVFPIDHVEVLSGHEAKLSDEDDYYNLRLGSADTYAQSEETYQIRYQVHTRDLRLGDIQSFYWNLISVNWDTTIEKVTFQVTMPKALTRASCTSIPICRRISSALSRKERPSAAKP